MGPFFRVPFVGTPLSVSAYLRYTVPNLRSSLVEVGTKGRETSCQYPNRCILFSKDPNEYTHGGHGRLRQSADIRLYPRGLKLVVWTVIESQVPYLRECGYCISLFRVNGSCLATVTFRMADTRTWTSLQYGRRSGRDRRKKEARPERCKWLNTGDNIRDELQTHLLMKLDWSSFPCSPFVYPTFSQFKNLWSRNKPIHWSPNFGLLDDSWRTVGRSTSSLEKAILGGNWFQALEDSSQVYR